MRRRGFFQPIPVVITDEESKRLGRIVAEAKRSGAWKPADPAFQRYVQSKLEDAA